jgi:hypothetical protein
MAFRPLCLSSYTVEYSRHSYSFGFKEKGGVGDRCIVVLPYRSLRDGWIMSSYNKTVFCSVLSAQKKLASLSHIYPSI